MKDTMTFRVWVQFPSVVDATQIRNEYVDIESEPDSIVTKINDGFWCYHDADDKLQLAEEDHQCHYLFSGYQIRVIENLDYNEVKVEDE